MKRIIPVLALLLAVCLPLTGCAAMLERTWSGSETHVDYPVAEDDSTLRVETYQALVNALLYYVSEHSYSGAIRLYNYSGDIEEDLERARAQVTEQDPLSAWAVQDLTCTVTRILTYYEADVRITYAHTAREVDAIRSVSGQAGLSAQLERLAEERAEQSVLLLSGFSGDAGLVDELFRLTWYGDPTRSEPAPPELRTAFYPETGTRRVAELTARWDEPPEDGEEYAHRLEEAAARLLAAAPPASERYTVEELAAILRGNARYDAEGSGLALAALTGEPVSEQGLILAMEYLCRQAGIPAIPVVGRDGGLWLIVTAAEGNRHLPAQGLLPQGEPSDPEAGPAPLLYTDLGMEALGYQWTAGLYPPCPEPGPAAAEPPATERP